MRRLISFNTQPFPLRLDSSTSLPLRRLPVSRRSRPIFSFRRERQSLNPETLLLYQPLPVHSRRLRREEHSSIRLLHRRLAASRRSRPIFSFRRERQSLNRETLLLYQPLPVHSRRLRREEHSSIRLLLRRLPVSRRSRPIFSFRPER